MAEPVRARRLTDAEGQTLLRIVRRGRHESVRVRRALIIMASASGTPVPAIAGLVQADHTLAALQSIRAARPDGQQLYVILDNLSANKTPAIRRWARNHKVELCFTPTSASWANPIEPRFGPLRSFVLGASTHPNHTVLARKLQDYLRWRNANARHPDVLAAQRRERARVRSQRHRRWGHPAQPAA